MRALDRVLRVEQAPDFGGGYVSRSRWLADAGVCPAGPLWDARDRALDPDAQGLKEQCVHRHRCEPQQHAAPGIAASTTAPPGSRTRPPASVNALAA